MDGEKVHLMPLDCTLKANMKVTTDTREMQRITREYNKKSHADKLGNWEEINKFLKTTIFPTK